MPDIEDLNKQFLENKKNNPENSGIKPLNGLKALSEQCIKRAKEMPRIPIKAEIKDYSRLFVMAKIPKRYKDADLKDFGFTDKKLVAYFSGGVLKRALDAGRGILLTGPYGMGKTRFAYAFVREYVKIYSNEDLTNSKFPLVCDFSEMIDTLNSFDDQKLFIKKCCDTPLLIIDDFMSVDITPDKISKLTQILGKRYHQMKPTVYTTNLKEPALKERCGLRLWERIDNVSYIKEVSGESKRPKYDNFELED